MHKRRHLILRAKLVWWIVGVCFYGFTSFNSFYIYGAVDHTDPIAVANGFLEYLRDNNIEAIVGLMIGRQQEEYQAMMQSNRDDVARIFNNYKKKIGKVTKVSDLRKMTTLSGKPGVAAKVKKKGGEVFVIILSKDGVNFYFENCLSYTAQRFKVMDPWN